MSIEPAKRWFLAVSVSLLVPICVDGNRLELNPGDMLPESSSANERTHSSQPQGPKLALGSGAKFPTLSAPALKEVLSSLPTVLGQEHKDVKEAAREQHERSTIATDPALELDAKLPSSATATLLKPETKLPTEETKVTLTTSQTVASESAPKSEAKLPTSQVVAPESALKSEDKMPTAQTVGPEPALKVEDKFPTLQTLPTLVSKEKEKVVVEVAPKDMEKVVVDAEAEIVQEEVTLPASPNVPLPKPSTKLPTIGGDVASGAESVVSSGSTQKSSSPSSQASEAVVKPTQTLLTWLPIALIIGLPVVLAVFALSACFLRPSEAHAPPPRQPAAAHTLAPPGGSSAGALGVPALADGSSEQRERLRSQCHSEDDYLTEVMGKELSMSPASFAQGSFPAAAQPSRKPRKNW